ncbi:MAG: sugar transporter [Mucilaginibacter sp.]|uniref:protein-disulfide reductase DsbD N-terminal domain-containing protein n=1 Tax=Mucilaginibacter sp. TaxID=1882438 RepID=UPI002615CF29|nr:protein-disulfide reductase DsbD N-terminal domain-containing protein [Mucilaginibacter sp.]MDB5004407.1 sugar transporter [Mucilaginibacter sp.]
MRSRTTISVCMLIWSATAFGQILVPVKWSYAAKKTGDHEAVLFFKAMITPGWHIYSVNQKEGGPLKTSFKLARSSSIMREGNVSEPEPVKKFEKAFEMDVFYFENEVVFQQKIRLKAGQTIVKGTLEYMACNDEKCLPPETISFNIPVK